MALVGCSYCDGREELPISSPWLCGCGAGWWGTHVIDYSESEVNDALFILSNIRVNINFDSAGAIMPFAVSLVGGLDSWDKNYVRPAGSPEGFIDTLLLFFPSIIVRDISHEDLAKAMGEKKFADYHHAGLIQTVTTYPELDLASLISGHPGFEIEGYDTSLTKLIYQRSPGEAEAAYWIRFNLGTVYCHDFIKSILGLGAIKKCRSSDGRYLSLCGHKYPLDTLIKVMPEAICRTELCGYLLGATGLTDSYYSIVNKLRDIRYSAASNSMPGEVESFYHWVRSRRISTARLRADEVFEFRSKFRTLAPFVSELKTLLSKNLRKKEVENIHEAFANELDNQVAYAKKVLCKGHDARAFFLTGLFSTLGNIIGGVPGALVGGIGGNVVTHLALNYDRNIPGEVTFIANIAV